jgi:hypothetical protein
MIMPWSQYLLLQLWDDLGIPHERSKQLHGAVLIFTGYKVDPNAMTITMSETQREAMVDEIARFLSTRKRTLCEFKKITRWLSWDLNVALVLRPCLSGLYGKMRGRNFPNQLIHINKQIKQEFIFCSSKFQTIPANQIINSVVWSLDKAD